MITRNFMYLRPGNLLKEFIVEISVEGIDKRGRPVSTYVQNGCNTFKGVLAAASASEQIRWEQRSHPVTHTVVQYGKPSAKAGDKLVLGDRVFLVQDIDEAGTVGVATIYYVEERNDIQ